MPQIGDIILTKDIGKKGHSKLIWMACIDCGKERWVNLRKGEPKSVRCSICSPRTAERREITRQLFKGKHHSEISKQKISEARMGAKNPSWRGGKSFSSGYISQRLYPDDSYFPMAEKSHYVLEHRLIMAKHIGRCLLPQEQVHHKNGIKDDNRIENLELMPNLEKHNSFTVCANCSLRTEIRLLRFQIRELQTSIQSRLPI